MCVCVCVCVRVRARAREGPLNTDVFECFCLKCILVRVLVQCSVVSSFLMVVYVCRAPFYLFIFFFNDYLWCMSTCFGLSIYSICIIFCLFSCLGIVMREWMTLSCLVVMSTDRNIVNVLK